jgi:hypothetical protein
LAAKKRRQAIDDDLDAARHWKQLRDQARLTMRTVADSGLEPDALSALQDRYSASTCRLSWRALDELSPGMAGKRRGSLAGVDRPHSPGASIRSTGRSMPRPRKRSADWEILGCDRRVRFQQRDTQGFVERPGV